MIEVTLTLIALVLFIGLGILSWASRSKSRGGRSRPASGGMNRQQIRDHWERIEGVFAQNGSDSTKHAVMEADKLLDIALRQAGCRGETLGERLKSARGLMPHDTYQGLWDAHKARNALAHELNFDLPKAVGRQKLDAFHAGIRALGVM
jgi:hypothetical protein